METAPAAVWKFKAKVSIASNQHTTIKKNYEPHLHILMINQSAVIESFEILSNHTSVEFIKPGDTSIINFRFSFRPEYIRKGMRLVFRDGNVKGVGSILETF